MRILRPSEPIDCPRDILHWTGNRVIGRATCAGTSFPKYQQEPYYVTVEHDPSIHKDKNINYTAQNYIFCA